MGYIYLASPYSHPDPEVREARYIAVRDATTWHLQRRLWVYSPIVHCHDLAKAGGLPTDFDFWQDYNRTMIFHADSLYVLVIAGWQQSKGVTKEILYAKELKLPIIHITLPL